MSVYRLGTETFTSKADVTARAKAIKDAHQPGEPLVGAELDFMYALLLWHPDAAQKIGVGVRTLMIRANPMMGHNEFYLVRTDGTGTDFSYKQCVQPSTPEADFRAACRVAVTPDIVAFERAYFVGQRISRCPLTGERLTRDNAHVDHIPPQTFAALLTSFCRDERLHPARIPLLGRTQDNSFRLRIADTLLEDRWIEYHREHAELRVISETANLQIVGKVWDGILGYLRLKDYADMLVEWKGKRWFYTHLPGLSDGVLLTADNAPAGTPTLDGTIAVIEMSLKGEQ